MRKPALTAVDTVFSGGRMHQVKLTCLNPGPKNRLDFRN